MALGLFLSLMLFSLVNGNLEQSAMPEQNGTYNQSCVNYGHKIKRGHPGWPFEVRCSDAILRQLKLNIKKKKNVTCAIRAPNGTVLWMSTFEEAAEINKIREYPRINVTDSMNATYSIEIKVPQDSFCAIVDVIVIGENYIEEYDCKTFPSSFNAPDEFLLGRKSQFMSCGVPGSAPVQLYGKASEYTYEWWHNCSNSLPSNAAVDVKDHAGVRFSNVTFSNGGEYVCGVRYGNQLRIIFRHIVCVKRPTVSRTTMKCPKRVGGKEGSDLQLTCFIDAGLGRIGFYSPNIIWYNATKSPHRRVCGGSKHFATHRDTNVDNDEVKCTNVQPKQNTFAEQRKVCFQYQPPPELDVIHKARYNITLLIKNLRRWDVGNFTVTHIYSLNYESRVIEVYLDTSENLTNTSVNAAIGVGILVLLILLLLLCYWRRHDILWCNKKYFGPYEREKKTHDAVLVYHYSRDDMKLSSKLQTETLVENIQLFLKEKCLTCYDENREDGDFQLQVQNVTKILDDCHRILIILNEEIAFDEWNLHKIYTAIKNSANGGTNVIFISLPGLKSKFRDAPNQSQIALKHAMKIGTTITWSGKAPFESTFKRRLEYVLPKKPLRYEDDGQQLPPAKTLIHTTV